MNSFILCLWLCGWGWKCQRYLREHSAKFPLRFGANLLLAPLQTLVKDSAGGFNQQPWEQFSKVAQAASCPIPIFNFIEDLELLDSHAARIEGSSHCLGCILDVKLRQLTKLYLFLFLFPVKNKRDFFSYLHLIALKVVETTSSPSSAWVSSNPRLPQGFPSYQSLG